MVNHSSVLRRYNNICIVQIINPGAIPALGLPNGIKCIHLSIAIFIKCLRVARMAEIR